MYRFLLVLFKQLQSFIKHNNCYIITMIYKCNRVRIKIPYYIGQQETCAIFRSSIAWLPPPPLSPRRPPYVRIIHSFRSITNELLDCMVGPRGISLTRNQEESQTCRNKENFFPRERFIDCCFLRNQMIKQKCLSIDNYLSFQMASDSLKV